MRSPREGPRTLALELIKEGLALLQEDGPGLGADNISLAQAVGRLNEGRSVEDQVAAGSVYGRLWVRPEDFRVDVLAAALYEWFAPTSSVEYHETLASVADTLDSMPPRTGDRDRMAALKEVARVAGRVNSRAVARDPKFHVRSAILGSLAAQPDLDEHTLDPLTKAAGDAYDNATDSYSELYRSLLEEFRLEPVAELFGSIGTGDEERVEEIVRIFSRLANSLSEGIATRSKFDREGSDPIRLPTGPNGDTQEWELFSVGIWALAMGLFGFAPDVETGNG